MRLRTRFILIGLALLYVSCFSTGKRREKVEFERVEDEGKVNYVEFREVFPRR